MLTLKTHQMLNQAHALKKTKPKLTVSCKLHEYMCIMVHDCCTQHSTEQF